MAKQAETKLQRRIRKKLEKEFGGWWVKIWGGGFQKAGIPDLIGCVEGLFFALEIKTATGKASTLQLETIHDIITDGKGVAGVVRSSSDAVRLVRQALVAAGRVPTKGRLVRVENEDSSTVLRAGNRKDVDSRGRARVIGAYAIKLGGRSKKQQGDKLARASS